MNPPGEMSLALSVDHAGTNASPILPRPRSLRSPYLYRISSCVSAGGGSLSGHCSRGLGAGDVSLSGHCSRGLGAGGAGRGFVQLISICCDVGYDHSASSLPTLPGVFPKCWLRDDDATAVKGGSSRVTRAAVECRAMETVTLANRDTSEPSPAQTWLLRPCTQGRW